jgi:hypothetical protein
VLGLGARDLMLRAGDLVFAPAKLRYGTFQLCIQFRDLQDRKSLASLDLVADINVDVLDVAGHLGMNVYNLIRLELAGEIQGMCNRAASDSDYYCGWDLSGTRCCVPVFESVCNDASQNRNCNSCDEEQGGSLSHMSNAPLYGFVIVRAHDDAHVLSRRKCIGARDH